jgi:acetylornithine deacetylase
MPLPVDSLLGSTFYSIGLINGGVAPNVISPHAWAEVLFRSVGPPEEILAAVADLAPLVGVQEVLRVPAVRLRTVPELPSEVFPFTTDVPLLDRWGEPLLFGPGSFLVAHTDAEHIALDEVEAAVETYEALIEHCLNAA